MENETKKEIEELKTIDNLDLNPTKRNENGLSNDQIIALEKLLEWSQRVVRNRDMEIFFALKGYAGTGKTTLISHFLKQLAYPYRASRICVSAPTHKAKKVIRDKTGWNNAETLQALLGLKLDVNLDDFDPNNLMFSPVGNRKIKDYDLVIVDEASMINSELYITIVECAISSGTKVLFVGDMKQLNPVKENIISPSLLTPLNQYELTEIVRQDIGNPLVGLLTILRDDIEHGTDKYLNFLQANPEKFNDKGEGYSVRSGEHGFGAALKEELLTEEFKADKNYCRYISWTNDSITKTNAWIREHVFAFKEKLLVGELILSYKTLSEQDYVIIVNSDDYIVDEIEDDTILRADVEIKTWRVSLRGVDTGNISKVNVVQPESENLKAFADKVSELLYDAKIKKGKAWVKFFDFRDNFVIMDTIMKDRALLTKKDLDYGYGITIHKSQGSTYNTVFVNGKDINKNQTDAERRRLWYVALSRASRRVYINL